MDDIPPADRVDDAAGLLGDGGDIDDAEYTQLATEAIGDGVDQHAIVHCTTTAGPITMHFHRDWSPNGYERATSLFERGYYDNSHFFRVVPHFLVQFGISYTTDMELKHFADSTIKDDPKREDLMPFKEGMLSFAGSGPNSRSSQLFIAYDHAGGLGNSPWETPFGEVVVGIENVRNLYSEYGDMPPWGKGPEQGPIRNRGSKYIEEGFPKLDSFETCTVQRMSNPQGSEKMEDNEFEEEEPPRDEADDQIATRDNEMADAHGKEQRRGMRGGTALKKKINKLLSEAKPNENNGKSSLVGIVALILVLFILWQLLARRNKQKSAGKSV